MKFTKLVHEIEMDVLYTVISQIFREIDVPFIKFTPIDTSELNALSITVCF